MSGVEVAGLVFGVLPVIFEAVKSYSTVVASLRTFRHYSNGWRSIALQLKVQNGIFLNEVRHILSLVQDERGIETMLQDHADRRWASRDLNDKLNDVLRENFDLCCDVINATRVVVEWMKKETTKFDILLERKSQNESIKAAIKRLRGAVKITFDKDRYETRLAYLRDSNDDLRRLRSQIGLLQQQNIHKASVCVSYKPLPTRFHSIRDASQKLHDTLCDAWCCENTAHQCHYAKLCLGAEVRTEVRLDLAISCDANSAKTKEGLSREPPIWLYVQSKSMYTEGSTQIATQTHAVRLQAPARSLNANSACSHTPKQKAPLDDIESSRCSKKTKRVHFDCATEIQSSTRTTTANLQPLPEYNLCQTKNICEYLRQSFLASKDTPENRCFGYLETPQSYKHLFFFRETTIRAAKPKHTHTQHANITTLFEAMKQDVEKVLQPRDQLKLAHKTALAILQYNDTSWLPERWRLGDMSYLGSQNRLDEAALETLHLSSRISASDKQGTIEMDESDCSEETAPDEIRYGINNTTLFSLGVALLEIAQWKPIEENMISRDEGERVITSRRLAGGRSLLGPDYQRITQKCLQCNFGFGTELSNRGLQTAVYNDVVCELEQMIERMSI